MSDFEIYQSKNIESTKSEITELEFRDVIKVLEDAKLPPTKIIYDSQKGMFAEINLGSMKVIKWIE